MAHYPTISNQIPLDCTRSYQILPDAARLHKPITDCTTHDKTLPDPIRSYQPLLDHQERTLQNPARSVQILSDPSRLTASSRRLPAPSRFYRILPASNILYNILQNPNPPGPIRSCLLGTASTRLYQPISYSTRLCHILPNSNTSCNILLEFARLFQNLKIIENIENLKKRSLSSEYC